MKYGDEAQKLAEWYADEGWAELGEATPTMAGLARQMGVIRRTLYLWRDKHEAFADVCDKLQSNQEFSLVNGGLHGKLNSNIVKLMMANHGYSDKVDTNHTSNDGTMSPKEVTPDTVRTLVYNLTD